MQSSVYNSSALASHPTQQGNSSSIGGGQRQNRLFALHALQDQEGSSDVATGMLRVFNLDVYSQLVQGDTFSFITPYIAVQFTVSPETLSEPF